MSGIGKENVVAPTLAHIQYPGLVLNKHKMVETLGGFYEIMDEMCGVRGKLELRLRPDDPFSVPIVSEKRPNLTVLVNVRREKKKQEGEVRTGKIKTKLLGISHASHYFKALADFQTVPHPHIDLRNFTVREDVEDFFVDQPIMKNSTYCDCNEKVFLPPRTFTRIQNAPMYHFNDAIQSSDNVASSTSNSSNQKSTINSVRAKRVNYTMSVALRSGSGVPLKPHDMINELQFIHKGRYEEEMKVLKEYFDAHPVRLRKQLIYDTGIPFDVTKKILIQVAYYVIDGPWRNTWIRFGYDPRTTPHAGKYQTMDYRFRDMSLPPSRCRRPIKLRHGDDRAGVMKRGVGRVSKALKEGRPSFSYISGEIPNKMNLFYQYCTVHLNGVDAILKEDLTDKCDEKLGWYREETQAKIRHLIDADVERVILQSTPVREPEKVDESEKTAKDVTFHFEDSDADDDEIIKGDENASSTSDGDTSSLDDGDRGGGASDVLMG